MNRKHIFYLISVLWLIIIIGLIGFKQFTLLTGTKVLLRTVPVDPRDILRGDYVVLNYEISSLNLENIPSDFTDLSRGSRIYLILERENKYWVAKEIRKNRPKNLPFIKGKVRDIYGKNIVVSYGIESYFVPEGEGVYIERSGGRGLDVEVSIDRFGNAIVNKLYLNDIEVKFK